MPKNEHMPPETERPPAYGAAAAAEGELQSIDERKFRNIDNEVARKVDRFYTNGNDGVENAQPGYRYAYITANEGLSTSGARADVRKMHMNARKNGYEPVAGDMPEDARYKGDDHANGTTLRGKGDTLLYRIHEEAYQAMMERGRQRGIRDGLVEERTVMFARERLGNTYGEVMHAGAGNFNDPVMRRAFGAAGQPEQVQIVNASEGDIRRGSMKDTNGRTVQPGFEVGKRVV